MIVAGGSLIVVLTILAIRWMLAGGEPSTAGAADTGLQANAPAPTSTSSERKPPQAPPMAASPVVAQQPKAPDPKSTTPTKISMGASLPTFVPTATAPATSTPQTALLNRQPEQQPEKVKTVDPPPAVAATPARSDPPPPAAGKPAETPGAPPSQRVQLGLDLIRQNKPVEARKVLSDALGAPSVSPAESERIRTELAKLNDRLVFGLEIAPDDAFASAYTIESGESLAKLPKKLGLSVDWRFLQRINQISNPAKIRAGQRIKIIKGPFHAIIDKRTFRMDLYMGDFSDRVYVRSFTVGLGEFGATPEGAFTVKADSKLINPEWTNPRTGEHFESNDPKNPLGEFWIGLIGASDNIRGLETYGIHGTIEPDSIGQERSMGCVRMGAEDIAVVYEMLMDNVSRVEIHGTDWP